MVHFNIRYVVPLIVIGVLLLGTASASATPASEVYLPLLPGGSMGEPADRALLADADLAELQAIAELTDADLALLTEGATLTDLAVATTGLRWKDHAAPFDFLFANHKDQHQQSIRLPRHAPPSSRWTKLIGFLYITYTDYASDNPQAKHVDCNAPEANCEVGWLMHGVSTTATLTAKGQGRPQYCVDASLQPLLDQGFTHFHWVKDANGCLREGNTYNGYLIRLVAIRDFEFFHSGSDSQHGGSGGNHDDGGCSGEDDGSHDDGGCAGDDGTHEDDGCTHDDGGTHDEGGCTDDSDGCSDSDSDGGSHDGDAHDGGAGSHGEGMVITPGIDWVSHANVTTCIAEP